MPVAFFFQIELIYIKSITFASSKEKNGKSIKIYKKLFTLIFFSVYLLYQNNDGR